ncbi:hypothetical protein [Renibacterium salmoninarum]
MAELFSAADVSFRQAVAEDVVEIVALLTDDALGVGREGTDLAPYYAAFAAIQADAG